MSSSSGSSGSGCGPGRAIIPLTLDYDKKPLTKEVKAKLIAICKSKGWGELKKEIIKYNENRDKIINEMENHPDPVFQEYLQFYKSSLGAKNFERNRLKVYAICNKHAMCRCLSLDEIVAHNNKAFQPNDRSSASASSDEEDD